MGLVIDTSAAVAVERAGEDWSRLLDVFAGEPVALPATASQVGDVLDVGARDPLS